MLKTNPYNRRGAVTDPGEYKGQGQLLAQIAGGLPQNFNVHGEPEMGKSSLLQLLSNPEGAREQEASARKRWLPLFVDLDFLPERSDLSFWRYLFDRLADKCQALGLESDGMRRLYEGATATRQLYDIQQTMLAYIKSLDRDVVLLLDNFDVVAEAFPEDEALATMGKLRAACQEEAGPSRNRVCVVLTTRDPLFVLCERRRLPKAGWSQLHSILEYAPLEPLDEEGALSLINGPWEGGAGGSPFTGEERDWALRLAGGHPALLKRTCHHLLKAKERGGVDFESLREVIEADPHVSVLLDMLWERITEAEARTHLRLESALTCLAYGEKCADHAALRELLVKGLVIEEGGGPRLASRILADFIKSRTKLLTGPPPAAAPAATHTPPPEIRLDEYKQTVDFQGKEISLTTLEFKLFRHLVQNAGRPCSREEIIKVLWDRLPPITGGKDALEHVITRLRRKIEVDHKHPRMILSIRKQGYLFHSEGAGPRVGESGDALEYADKERLESYAPKLQTAPQGETR